MRILDDDLAKDERGVEPTVMKILVGVILVSIGLGIGITMYQRFGREAQNYLNYEVTLNQGSTSISRGDSTTVQVEVSTTIDYDKEILLSAEGYTEEDVSISFNPDKGNPSFGSTMNISVDNNADTSNSTITVKAQPIEEGGEKTANLQLTITE